MRTPRIPRNLRWALVTGASRGIGFMMAKVLIQRGYHLLLTARDQDRLEKAREYLRPLNPDLHISALPLDLRDPEAAYHRLEAWLKDYPPVQLLVNNAGIYRTGPFAESDPREGEEMLRVNLLAPIWITRLVLPGMITLGSGTVIFVASQAGRSGFPENTYYCASKFGIVGFAEALFEEVRGLGIKVVTLLPGYVRTDMVKDRPGLHPERMIPPEDLGRTLEYILDLKPQSTPVEIHLRPLMPVDEPPA